MKRVLQIMGGLNRGGIETFVMNIYRSIDRNEIQFDFLLTQVSGGDYEEEAKSLGANIYHLPARNRGYISYRRSLDSFFHGHNNYIAVHEHVSSLTSIEPLFYAKKYGIPVRILHAHSSSIQKSLRLHWVHTLLHYLNKPLVHSMATNYLGCSDKALDWMYKYTGIRSQAIMIKNGINCDNYVFNENLRNDVRAEFELCDTCFLIGHVGRFIPLKNQIFLVGVMQELCKIMPYAKLMLVGDGDTKKEVQSYVETKNLSDAVIFTGTRSDVARLMQAMDVFVMPSWFEGLPVSLVEAQAAGLPIIASDTISHDSDLSGTILFKSIKDSASDWAKSIVEWKNKLQRPDNIEAIKQAGFDSRETAKQLVGIYTGNV